MFCPKCGTKKQSPESYCRFCGVWLVDPDVVSKKGLFRKSTREEKIRKIRTLETISIGMSITSAAIIFSYLFLSLDRGLLFLAMTCGILVAAYQAINIYLGHKVTKGLPRQQSSDRKQNEQPPVLEFPAHTARQLNVPASVTDNTTELLDPVNVSRNKSNS
jgi:hypothetical protein